jgi:regulator of sigma E protease
MIFLTGTVSVVLYGLLYLVVLGIVVVVHEYGHFIVGRWCGVKVEAFSIGFGPELFGWVDRRGTRWRVAAIPLGGYVRFAGDANAASIPDAGALAMMAPEERSVTLQSKSVAQRAAIVAAGPIANFLLSIVILTGLYTSVGWTEIAPIVGSFSEDSAAQAAGLKVGDRIEAIDGSKIDSFMQILPLVATRAGDHLKVTVLRDGQTLDFDVVPKLLQRETDLGVERRGLLGIGSDNSPVNVHHEGLNIPEAFVKAIDTNWQIVTQTLQFFGRLFTGHEYVDQISGVARMAHAVAESASFGFGDLLARVAMISASIGLLNLFPIPVLDGGHLVFFLFEAIRGKPLPERVQDVGFRIGMTLVLALMLVANGNDLIHYGGRFLANWVH